MGLVVVMWQRGLKAVASLFTLSGKDRGLGFEL
jgi:hypothetical protein